MPSCSVKWCMNHTSTISFKTNKGVSFHRFPRNEVLCQKWVEAVRLERRDPWWTSTKASRICSMHFRESDMTVTPCKVNILSKTAVPVCTMVCYENENNLSSNLSHDLENTRLYDNNTRTYETKRSLSEVLKESKINIPSDKESAIQEAEKAFVNIKLAKNQQLNGYPDTEATNDTKTTVQENEDKEKSFCISELNTKDDVKTDEKHTFIKLNENTGVIVTKNLNNEINSVEKCNGFNIESQIQNSNTCKSNEIVEDDKEPNIVTSDEKTDLCPEEIKKLDLKYTFVAKILKTYLPKRKYINKPRIKTSSGNCDKFEENQCIDLKNHNLNGLAETLNSEKVNEDICMQNIIKENFIEIQEKKANGKDVTINRTEICNSSICEEFTVNKSNVNDGKEQENTDFNDDFFDLVGKSKIAYKEPEKEIYTEANENMCIEPSTGLFMESNTHLILDLDTNIYTETNALINEDNSKKYFELTNEQNNKINDMNGTTFTTDWVESGVGIQIYDNLNASTHTNELSFIDNTDPEELKDNLNLEPEYNLFAVLDRVAPDGNQNGVILRDNPGLEEIETLNLETSENIEIGMENLQFEVELTSPFNRLHPESSKEKSFGNIESPLNNNYFEEISKVNILEKALNKSNKVKENQIISIADGVEGQTHTPEKTLENMVLLEEAEKNSYEASSNTSAENREAEFHQNKAKNNLSMSLNLYNDMYATKKILLPNFNVGTKPKIAQTKDLYPELVKYLSEKPKMDSLAELCKNTLTEVDKKIFSKYGNLALKNKKMLQNIQGNNYENIDFEVINIVEELENNIDGNERDSQFNLSGLEHSQSKLDSTNKITRMIDSNIAEKMLSEELLSSCNNFSKFIAVGSKITDSEPNTGVLSDLIENELQSAPEDTVKNIEKDQTKEFFTGKDSDNLCGKFCLDLENVSPVSVDKFVDDEMKVIESNMDIDKENSTEFDINLLDGDSIAESVLEDLDNNSNSNLDCNEKDSNDGLMDIRPDDIPESIDAILDEEGSLFENLDLLEEDSQGSNREIANKSTGQNFNNTKTIKKALTESHFDQLLESFANENISSTGLEESENSICQIKSKLKQFVEKCLDDSIGESDITMNLNKLERFGKNSFQEAYEEIIEERGLNIDEIKNIFLDDFYEQKTKEIENNFNHKQLKSTKVNLQGEELENNVYPVIEESDGFEGQENEDIFDQLKHLEDVLFKGSDKTFTNKLVNQNCGSKFKECQNNKNDDVSKLNEIAQQKEEVSLSQEVEQREELFNQNDVSDIDEILDELCKHHTKVENKFQNEKEKSDLITKPRNIQQSFKEENEQVLKDFHNENIQMSECGKKNTDSPPIERGNIQSDKLNTKRKIQSSVEQLKAELFSQCFSPDCGNNCMKAHRKIRNNNIQRFKNQNIDISNQSQIKKRQRRFSAIFKNKRRNNNQSINDILKKQTNKSNCGSSSNEKLKLKYKEFSIDLLKGECFEFSQKGNEGETNLGHKEFKRKNSDTNLEQRKVQCTESIIAKNKNCPSIEISFNKDNLIEIDIQNDDCTKSKEPMEECPKCGYVTEDENCDVDLNITEPLSVINDDMFLSKIEKKKDGNDENKKVPLRTVYAMELAYVTAIQALQKKLRKKMAMCDYRLRKMNNLIQINNRLIKDNISLKCNTNVV